MKATQLQLVLCVLLAAITVGCLPPESQEPGFQEIVVYTALDQEFSQPIFDAFTRRTGIIVRAKFDTESTKTVALANEIIAERARTRCDLFWNNEILNSLRLEREGLLDVYRSPQAENYPAMYRSAKGTWHGFAARARVLLVNTDLVPLDQRPTSIHDLADPRWSGRVGLAKPLFGTTATHAACLFAYWGDARAREFFLAVKENARIMAGNKQVARAVAGGSLAFGLTDTDDAIIEVEQGMPVAIIYPDQEPDGLGTLFIPNTLAIIRGAPHALRARKLVDYLLSAEVELQLAQGRSAQIPLNRTTQANVRVETPATVRAMQIDFAEAADRWQAAAEFLRDEFTGPQ